MALVHSRVHRVVYAVPDKEVCHVLIIGGASPK
jgi:hypothetical protein